MRPIFFTSKFYFSFLHEEPRRKHEGNTKNREEDEETGFNLKPGSLSKQIIGADIEIHRLPVMCLLKSPFKVFMIYNREKWNRELNVKNFNLRERN